MNSSTDIPATVDSISLDKLTKTLTTIPPISFLVTPETLIISAEHENNTSLTQLSDAGARHESLSFILVPVLVILVVALFSGLAIHCIQKRQRLDNLRHTLIPLYIYNRDEDEWGVLLDTRGGRNSDPMGRDSRYSN